MRDPVQILGYLNSCRARGRAREGALPHGPDALFLRNKEEIEGTWSSNFQMELEFGVCRQCRGRTRPFRQAGTSIFSLKWGRGEFRLHLAGIFCGLLVRGGCFSSLEGVLGVICREQRLFLKSALSCYTQEIDMVRVSLTSSLRLARPSRRGHLVSYGVS